MATGSMSKWAKIRAAAENFLHEKGIESEESFGRSGFHRFAHFWLLVIKSFGRNRCPVRAASLAYTTLLALVPLLAVGVSITTSVLQSQGKEPIRAMIDKMVGYVAPALDLQEIEPTAPPDEPGSSDSTAAPVPAPATNRQAVAISNATTAATNVAPREAIATIDKVIATNAATVTITVTNAAGTTNVVVLAKTGRAKVAEQIFDFISNVDTGALGLTSVLALLFVGISLLRTIEATFNDIWGVTKGRTIVKSIVYYWATITLGPIFLVAAFALMTGPYFERTDRWLELIPFGKVIFANILPAFILTFGLMGFYAFMPNTRVHWKAAMVGGAVAGVLWQLNYAFSIIYVSRVATYTKFYGSLAVFPLFLIGLYFSWLIMLFGAQVAYAFQNREAYIEERQAESVNQRGREFVALRLMTYIAERFIRGEKPASLVEISCALGVPSALVSKLLCTFVHTGLLLEVADTEIGYAPARPVNKITAHDVIRALRAGQGLELATKEDPWRTNVRTEFERIVDAERSAAQTVTLDVLAQQRAEMARTIA